MDGNPINYTDVRGLYVENDNGTYSLEKGETVGQMHSKLKKDGKTDLSYDEFAKENSLDRKTGLINGGVVKSSTQFKGKMKSPQTEKEKAVKVNTLQAPYKKQKKKEKLILERNKQLKQSP